MGGTGVNGSAAC